MSSARQPSGVPSSPELRHDGSNGAATKFGAVQNFAVVAAVVGCHHARERGNFIK